MELKKISHRIVAKLKLKYWRTIHKFGIRIPKSLEEAYQIDREIGTTFWTNAIKKEMKNCRKSFKKLHIRVGDMRKGK